MLMKTFKELSNYCQDVIFLCTFSIATIFSKLSDETKIVVLTLSSLFVIRFVLLSVVNLPRIIEERRFNKTESTDSNNNGMLLIANMEKLYDLYRKYLDSIILNSKQNSDGSITIMEEVTTSWKNISGKTFVELDDNEKRIFIEQTLNLFNSLGDCIFIKKDDVVFPFGSIKSSDNESNNLSDGG
jgi:hypothetical protein